MYCGNSLVFYLAHLDREEVTPERMRSGVFWPTAVLLSVNTSLLCDDKPGPVFLKLILQTIRHVDKAPATKYDALSKATYLLNNLLSEKSSQYLLTLSE